MYRFYKFSDCRVADLWESTVYRYFITNYRSMLSDFINYNYTYCQAQNDLQGMKGKFTECFVSIKEIDIFNCMGLYEVEH